MLKKQAYFPLLFLSAMILSVRATPVLADGFSVEEALPTDRGINAPPPPLLQMESPTSIPENNGASTEEMTPTAEEDPWLMISEGMILLQSGSEGNIASSEDPKQLLGVGDTVYLRSKDDSFSPEEELVVYRISRPVFHPTTAAFLGDLVQILGVVKVTSSGESVSTAKIVLSKSTISRGDLLAGIDHFILPPSAQTKDLEEGLEAMIVETPENHVSRAQHDIVYIDQGQDEGLTPGDQFVVIHGGEREGALPTSNSNSDQEALSFPYREIGTMVVLNTQEHTATAKITSSIETITKGDPVLYVK
jgi:hypothetical protein